MQEGQSSLISRFKDKMSNLKIDPETDLGTCSSRRAVCLVSSLMLASNADSKSFSIMWFILVCVKCESLVQEVDCI